MYKGFDAGHIPGVFSQNLLVCILTSLHRNNKKSLGFSNICRNFAANKMHECMMSEEERLVKILQLSHSQVLAGKSYSQEEAERYLDDRLYEFRNKMVGTSVAEPC